MIHLYVLFVLWALTAYGRDTLRWRREVALAKYQAKEMQERGERILDIQTSLLKGFEQAMLNTRTEK